MDKAQRKIKKILGPHPYLAGKHGILGVMPDWNPAEIIGIKPRPLAFSLYKYFITDQTWAYQRDNYGYRNLRSFPLIHNILGLPYVDVRLSFNSFIPKSLDDQLASKLVDYYLDKLRQSPAHHDKVEFDIVYSCYFFNLNERLLELKQHGFSDIECMEISKHLLSLTRNILEEKGVFYKDIEKIKELERRQAIIDQSDLPILDRIYWLGEDCKRYGTLPFAGLARAGFIAVQMLNSLVDVGIFTLKDKNNFMASVKTVAKDMAFDRQSISKQAFLEKYGHLRPGTYDILIDSYKEKYDFYFPEQNLSSLEESPHFNLTQEQRNLINSILSLHHFKLSADEFIHFIKLAIEQREYSKFVFTKSVSNILELIKNLGAKYDLDKEELSYLNIQTIVQLYGNLDTRELQETIKENITINKERYQTTKCLKFPPLITRAEDIFYYELEKGSPNFVTLERCMGEKVDELELSPKTSLKGKVVLIKSADPGYDWLFTHSPAGFITMYGGANSHMAIRAAELKIPAVIGCGEKNFHEWSKGAMLEIDCAKKVVTIIK
jgi:phosphohistidine swiveling domain-containing protein